MMKLEEIEYHMWTIKLTKQDKRISGMAGNYIDDVFTTQSSILMGTNFILTYDWLKIGVSAPDSEYIEFTLTEGIESYQLIICDNILINLISNKSDDFYIQYYYSLNNINKMIRNVFGSISYRSLYS